VTLIAASADSVCGVVCWRDEHVSTHLNTVAAFIASNSVVRNVLISNLLQVNAQVLLRVSILTRNIDIANLSVRPSVRPLRSGIV